MTFLDLAWKNAWRKPLRTVLLMICVAVAFLIYGLTASFLAGSQGASAASEDIIGVMSAVGRTQALPRAPVSPQSATWRACAVLWMSRRT
jgi:putative ABC transport system permease protein